MIMKIQFMLMLLICGCTSFTGNKEKNIDSIKNDSLKEFVNNFTSQTLPFNIDNPHEENVIDKELLKQFLNIEFDDENAGLEEYYYGDVFYGEDYIGLIHTHYYTPGAFGIENYFIEFASLTYDGKLISKKELGCFCNDTNMGINDYYATEVALDIEMEKITVIEKTTHGTLIEEEGVEPFEEISQKEYSFNISSSGSITKVKE